MALLRSTILTAPCQLPSCVEDIPRVLTAPGRGTGMFELHHEDGNLASLRAGCLPNAPLPRAALMNDSNQGSFEQQTFPFWGL